MPADLRVPILWLTSARAVSDGRACRDLTVHDGSGAPLLVARAFTWGREIVVRHAGETGTRFVVLRRRASFPLTGKVDVLDASTGGHIGLLHRNGRVRDARGAQIGRFVDARSLRRRAAEGLIDAIGTAIVGGDSVGPSSTDGFAFTLGPRVLGTLRRQPLPFEPAADSGASHTSRLARILPAKLRAAVANRLRPTGWRFERTNPPPDEDPRLPVAGAIFTVELSHW